MMVGMFRHLHLKVSLLRPMLKQIFNTQVPLKELSAKNPAFTSTSFKKFLRNHEIQQFLTSAHHPQTNAKNELVYQSIVNRLK